MKKKKADKRKITLTFSGTPPHEIAKMRISGFGPGNGCILATLTNPLVSVTPNIKIVPDYDLAQRIATSARLTILIEGDML